MYRTYIKTKNRELESVYKRYRNKLNGLMFKAEKDYYDRLITENKKHEEILANSERYHK